MKNKRGVSAVVGVVILVLIVLALIAIVWTVVNTLVRDKMDQSESCFGSFGEVTINNAYTCYSNLSGEELQFSISIGDLNVDEVLVSVSEVGLTKNLKIPGTYNYVKPYKGSYGMEVKLPEINGGLTYILDLDGAGFSGKPDSIKLSPTINDNQCGVSDSSNSIDDCQALI